MTQERKERFTAEVAALAKKGNYGRMYDFARWNMNQGYRQGIRELFPQAPKPSATMKEWANFFNTQKEFKEMLEAREAEAKALRDAENLGISNKFEAGEYIEAKELIKLIRNSNIKTKPSLIAGIHEKNLSLSCKRYKGYIKGMRKTFIGEVYTAVWLALALITGKSIRQYVEMIGD